MFVYNQTTGTLYHGSLLLGTGYAGNGEWKNKPAAQTVEGHGPLPVGFYTIGPVHDDPKLGPCVMALTPDAGNQMFGRSAFFLHGDEIAHPGDGSDGCIVQPRVTRSTVALSSDRRLQVIAGSDKSAAAPLVS